MERFDGLRFGVGGSVGDGEDEWWDERDVWKPVGECTIVSMTERLERGEALLVGGGLRFDEDDEDSDEFAGSCSGRGRPIATRRLG